MGGEEVLHARGAATAVRVHATAEMIANANATFTAAQVHTDMRKGPSQLNLSLTPSQL